MADWNATTPTAGHQQGSMWQTGAVVWRRQRILNNYDMPRDALPICPHCGKEIDGLMAMPLETDSGTGAVWVCPGCMVIIGVTERAVSVPDQS